jgi:hypothetical protein
MPILHENEVLCTLDKCPKSFLTVTQGLLGQLALRDIEMRASGPQRFAVLIPFNDLASRQYPLPSS